MHILDGIINKFIHPLKVIPPKVILESRYLFYPGTEKIIEFREINLEPQEDRVKEKNIRDNIYYILNKIMTILASNLEFDETAQNIVDVMVNSMGYQGGVLFIVREKENCLQSYTYSSTAWTREVVKRLPFKTFKDIKLSLDTKNDLLVDIINKRKIYITKGIAPFVMHLVPWKLAKWVDVFTQTKYSISVPVILKNQVAGVVNINSKNDFTDKEIEMFRNFSKQVSIAINNSQQYEQIKYSADRLGEETQDLEALISLGQASSSSLEIEKNIQDILDILPIKLGHIKLIGAGLLRCNDANKTVYVYSATKSALVKNGVKLLFNKESKNRLSDYYSSIDENNPYNYNLTVKAILSNTVQKGENFLDFTSPPADRNTAWLMQKIMNIKSTVVIPINIRDTKLGALIFMFSKPLADISQRDLNLIETFSRQIGVMLENLNYYETLNKNIAELERTKSNLQEILTMKNDFLHIVSHQLRTPLTAVRGLISMWRDGDFDHYTANKMKAVKDRVSANADRLNNIINDMIVAMESEGELKLEFGLTDVEKLIKENIEMLKANYEKKGLYIKYSRISENIPEIEADAKYLLHVFMNIIDNAEKYTERGGLEIAVQREGDNVYIRFTDTGIGISEEDRKNLFQKFSRGKKSDLSNPNGSGLGLYIAKQILDEHHGRIQASSLGEGKGATFVVELPVRQEASVLSTHILHPD